MNKTWQLVFIFIGIFVTGVVTGGFIAVRYVRSVAQRRIAEQIGVQQLRQCADQLHQWLVADGHGGIKIYVVESR